MKRILFFYLMFVGIYAYAQDKPIVSSELKPLQVFPDSIKWVDAKPPLPPGAKTVLLEGNPKMEGVYTIRMKFPPNYLLKPHTHPKDERVTVLSGTVYVGLGDVADKKNVSRYNAGSFYVNPAGIHHYVFTGDEEAIFQLTGIGPWRLDYLDETK